MVGDFLIKSKNNVDIKIVSDGVIVKFFVSPETANQEHILKNVIGNSIKGYSLQSDKGLVLPINNEDVAKFNEILPILKKHNEDVAKKNLKVGCLGFVGVFALLLVASSIFGTKEAPSNSRENKNSSISSTQNEKDLGYQPEEFKSRFNAATSDLKTDLSISNINIEEGEVNNTFTTRLNDYSNIVGAISKQTGKVKSLTYIGVPNGNTSSSLGIIIGMGVMIQATNPSLNATERGEVLKKLGLLETGVDLTDFHNSIIEGDIKYSIVASSVTGIAFIIEPPE